LVPVAYAPRTEGPAPPSSPLLPYIFDTALRFDFVFWLAKNVAHDTVVQALLATRPELLDTASPEEQARVELILDHIQPVSPRRKGLVNDAAISASPPRYELERIWAPTLVMSAEDDLFGTYENARYTASHIPGARFVGFAQGGHMWVGHHQEVVTTISLFLKGRLP
jgi:pimeloyl-ACP methyl ester carboxylesterase